MENSSILSSENLACLANGILSTYDSPHEKPPTIMLPRPILKSLDCMIEQLDFEKNKIPVVLSCRTDPSKTESYEEYKEIKSFWDLADGKGYPIGVISCNHSKSEISNSGQGFIIWFLGNRRFSVNLFCESYHTVAGLGGRDPLPEEITDLSYDTPLAKMANISRAGEISFENEFISDKKYQFVCFGPTIEELVLRRHEDKRHEYWRNVIGSPDGFVPGRDSFSIPDPEWILQLGDVNIPTSDAKITETKPTENGAIKGHHYNASTIIRFAAEAKYMRYILRAKKGKFWFNSIHEDLSRLEKTYDDLANYPSSLPKTTVTYDGVCVTCSNVKMGSNHLPDEEHRCQPWEDDPYFNLELDQKIYLQELTAKGLKCPFYSRK
jgi:hypothetical protein